MNTLPNACNMARDSAVGESSASGARDEEEGDADGAADGTKSNDAEWNKQIRELRRFFPCNILRALPCAQDAPGLWFLSGQIWAHLTRADRTHVGAVFRPVAELDAGAITVKNPLGCRLLRS
jgi:hypothetical protein